MMMTMTIRCTWTFPQKWRHRHVGVVVDVAVPVLFIFLLVLVFLTTPNSPKLQSECHFWFTTRYETRITQTDKILSNTNCVEHRQQSVASTDGMIDVRQNSCISGEGENIRNADLSSMCYT
eukprot:2767968-Amphidinium_carterae.1